MYCSTCGSQVPDGKTFCHTCGAAMGRSRQINVSGSLRLDPPSLPAHAHAADVAICPRCGYRGESASYFSRGGHVAALVGLTVLTAGMMGAGGIGYYLLRREHRICPRCGDGWGRRGERALALVGANGMRVPLQQAQADDDILESGGGGKRGLSVFMFIMAAIFFIPGVAAFEMVALLFSAMFATGGFLLRKSAQQEREERREALIQRLQLPVLQLASKKGGRLTVTDVSTALGWPIPRAEKVLNSLEDGLRVTSDITEDGVIVYDFLELKLSRDRLLGGSGGPSAGNALPA